MRQNLAEMGLAMDPNKAVPLRKRKVLTRQGPAWPSVLPFTSLTPVLGLRPRHRELGQPARTVAESPFTTSSVRTGPGLELLLHSFFPSEINLFASTVISKVFSRIYLFLPLTFIVRTPQVLGSLLTVRSIFPQSSSLIGPRLL